MEAFAKHTGVVAPLDRVDVDTDQIIPKQFLKSISRTGFEAGLFYDWRFRPDGSPNPEFVLNKPQYREATVLVSGRNFGSGSSREHAPWALQQAGFKAVIAPSFADIFFNNSFKNGFLPIVLTESQVSRLFDEVAANRVGRGAQILQSAIGARADEDAIERDVLNWSQRPQIHVHERLLN